MPLLYHCLTSAPFDENSYLLWREGRSDCWIVDPGFDQQLIFDEVERLRLTPAVIVNTHGHADHIAGNEAMKQRWSDAPLVIGRGDAPALSDPRLNLSAQYGFALRSPPADRLLDDEERFEAAGLTALIRETPGHSPGHIVLIFDDPPAALVLGGDVLFAGGIGRTDFPNGSFEQLRNAIHAKLFTLADNAIVLPGHGPTTTIGQERRTNPFVGKPAGYDV